MLLSTARSGLAELQPKKSTSESGLKIELTSTPSSGSPAEGLVEGLSVGEVVGFFVGEVWLRKREVRLMRRHKYEKVGIINNTAHKISPLDFA